MSVPADDPSASVKSTSQQTDVPLHRESRTWRVALFVLIVSGILWLGGAYVRAIIGNDLLNWGTLEFVEYIPPDAEEEIFRLLSFVSISIIVSYSITLVSSAVFLATCPFKLKENGWLMMSAILFYLFVPAEAFTMYLDGKMIYNEFFTTADNEVFRALFLARLGALAGTPFIATLCYFTIIGLAVFQPLKKRPAHTT
jgi:hypothetical protein